ncbi:MAG TPA: sialate O-acetylesterase [Phycisphaerae bacterium]|nr:sialate O-acetylesterase [Phycisphaerae bacterium]
MTGAKGVVGVVIDEGPRDWQILQRRANGTVDIAVSGRWGSEETACGVDVRLVNEDDGAAVTADLDWTAVRTRPDGTWSGVLKDVPTGGLYRLETHLRTAGNPAIEWSQRGDMRHFLGVGDLWVIAGQSNSAGYGRGPCPDPPQLGVHVLNNAMRWALATQPLNESTDTAHPVNREQANSGHSPWLQFAKQVRAATGLPIGLVQTSLGGSPLAAWDPASGAAAVLFDNMVRVVEAAGGKVRGVLWYQGESDAGGEQAKSYERRFVSAVRAWRKALKSPDLHVLTVQINRNFVPPDEPADRGWSRVREAERRIPHRLKNVTVVPTLDLGLSDGIHVSPRGNLLLGERAARTVLGAVYGVPLDALAPEPATARRFRAGKVIEIAFDNVSSRIECIDPTSVPFRVEDAAGWVDVERVQYTGGHKVRLHLARAASGRTVVHGAFGRNPPTVPCDMVRMMPMLGFYDFPVK